MNSLLNKNVFFVKEHTGIFKAANNYDIYDPETREIILECREPNLGFLTRLIRFTDYKTHTPFEVIISANGEKILTIKRGISIFLSTVKVLDENDILIGTFKQKLFSIGGKFDVLDPQDQVLCSLKGSWTGWDFRFSKDNIELAQVTKKWAGVGKELFTTADNYVLAINDSVPANNPVRQMILAAVMCIDMVLKER
jgi:uncharacterized protein YxjI